MNVSMKKMGIKLASGKDLDLIKTFDCGQCFRWNADGNGVYLGVVKSKAASVWTDGNDVFIDDGVASDIEFWRKYFDLDNDYEAMTENFYADDYLKKCAEFGRGIRILRQDRWEVLCSLLYPSATIYQG
jgi:N-glycosylase/DNA lyase